MKRTYLGLHLVIMLYAVGGIFSKRAAMTGFLSPEFIGNYLAVLVILAVYAFFWQMLLKRLPLTVAMANKAATVIWGLVYGALFFHEKITVCNIVGAGIIIVGIVLVTGEEKESGQCT